MLRYLIPRLLSRRIEGQSRFIHRTQPKDATQQYRQNRHDTHLFATYGHHNLILAPLIIYLILYRYYNSH